VAHLVENGVACTEGLQVALGSVRNPGISVGKVTVNGRRATAVILASARGQRALVSVLGLIDTADGWRIASLNSSLPPTGRRGRAGGG
jgi:hypothetical protein